MKDFPFITVYRHSNENTLIFLFASPLICVQKSKIGLTFSYGTAINCIQIAKSISLCKLLKLRYNPFKVFEFHYKRFLKCWQYTSR